MRQQLLVRCKIAMSSPRGGPSCTQTACEGRAFQAGCARRGSSWYAVFQSFGSRRRRLPLTRLHLRLEPM